MQKARALTEINSLEAAIADATVAISLDATRPEAYLAKGMNIKQFQDKNSGFTKKIEKLALIENHRYD